MIIGSTTSSNSNGASFSPISELGPSLAAFIAGGTIIAARSPLRPSIPRNDDSASSGDKVDGECIVVLFRSPIVSESQPGSGMKQTIDAVNLTVTLVFVFQIDDEACVESNNEGKNYYHGLPFLPNEPANFPFLTSSSSNNLRILHAPSGLLVTATEFPPDADHILNVAAGRVFSRISVFDRSSPLSSTRSKSVDPHRLVHEDLSSMMIDAAMSNGGQSLGVQLLAIEQSAFSQRTSRGCSLDMYTIDPSGGWRSCIGRGTAVWRGAERINSKKLCPTHQSAILEDVLSEAADIPYGLTGALNAAIASATDALEWDGESNDMDS